MPYIGSASQKAGLVQNSKINGGKRATELLDEVLGRYNLAVALLGDSGEEQPPAPQQHSPSLVVLVRLRPGDVYAAQCSGTPARWMAAGTDLEGAQKE